MATDYVGFANWLRSEMAERGLRQIDLARMTGVDRAYISKVLSLEKPASETFCNALATAFGIEADEVFIRAGKLPPKAESDLLTQRLVSGFNKLTEDERQEVLEIVALKLRRRARGKGAANEEASDAA